MPRLAILLLLCLTVLYSLEASKLKTCLEICGGEPINPVCGNDGITYINRCLLECMGMIEVDFENCKPWRRSSKFYP